MSLKNFCFSSGGHYFQYRRLCAILAKGIMRNIHGIILILNQWFWRRCNFKDSFYFSSMGYFFRQSKTSCTILMSNETHHSSNTHICGLSKAVQNCVIYNYYLGQMRCNRTKIPILVTPLTHDVTSASKLR